MKKVILSSLVLLILFVENVSAQTRETIAVITLKNVTHTTYTTYDFNLAQSEIEILCGYITTELMKTRQFRLVERSRVSEVIREQRFQESNLSIAQIQSIGRILGVNKIITGEYSYVVSIYRSANIRIIDVRSGLIDASASIDREYDLEAMAANLVNQLMEYY